MTDEQMSKTYTRLVLEGKLRQAVRFITQRDQGGVLQIDALDSKSGLPVLDVLKSKHPKAVIPPPEVLEEYEKIPSFVPLDITATTVVFSLEDMFSHFFLFHKPLRRTVGRGAYAA